MKNGAIVLMILGAALSRLIPHAPNFTAVTALALLGGAYLTDKKWAILAPIAALWISDWLIGFHSLTLYVYASVAVIGLGSAFFLRPTSKSQVGLASVLSSLFFFVVTNYGVWAQGVWYPKTTAGLMETYFMALPFLGTQVIGDLFYTAVLFGSVHVLRAWKPSWVAAESRN